MTSRSSSRRGLREVAFGCLALVSLASSCASEPTRSVEVPPAGAPIDSSGIAATSAPTADAAPPPTADAAPDAAPTTPPDAPAASAAKGSGPSCTGCAKNSAGTCVVPTPRASAPFTVCYASCCP